MSTRYDRERDELEYRKGYVDGQSRQGGANVTLGVLVGAILVLIAGLGAFLFLRQESPTTESQPNIINVPESNTEQPEINIEVPEISPPEVTFPEVNLDTPEGLQSSPEEGAPSTPADSDSNN